MNAPTRMSRVRARRVASRARLAGFAMALGVVEVGAPFRGAAAQEVAPVPNASHQTVAQSLFDRARELMEQRDFERACPLLAESQRLDPGAGTQLNLAVSHEGARKLATAHTEFNEALSQAIRDNRKDRQELTRERIAAIAPRLSKLTIDVPRHADIAGLTIALDGRDVSRAAWGIQSALDGGPHRIDASAPGRAPWSTTVVLAVASADEHVVIPVLTPTQAPLGAFATCPAGMVVQSGICKPQSRRSNVQRYIGTGAAVAGGISIAVGLGSGFVAMYQSIQLGSFCNSRNECPAAFRDDVDAYEVSTTLSTTTFIVGGVLLVGGVVLMTTAPRATRSNGDTDPANPAKAPTLAIGPMGALGTF